MKFTSYAQNFEDIILWRALKDVRDGFYIDVGAGDPVADSVTLAFYERGWRGVNIEPMRQHHERLKAFRPRDINLQIALGKQATGRDSQEVQAAGLAPAMQDSAAHGLSDETLAGICAIHASQTIHFLKIEANGIESRVLQEMDFSKWRPWVIVIRVAGEQGREPVRRACRELAIGAGYRFAYFDGFNDFYVAEEQVRIAERLGVPPNRGDEFVLCSGHALSYPLDEFHGRIAQLKTQCESADLKTLGAEREKAHSDRKIQEIAAELQAQKTKINHERTRVRAVEDELRLEREALQAVYRSTSWRVTAPLRWCSTQARMLKGVHLMAVFVRLPKKILSDVFHPAAQWLKRSAYFKTVAARAKSRFPNAWERIMKPIREAGAVNASAGQALTDRVDNNLAANHMKDFLRREIMRRQQDGLERQR